MVAKFIFVFFIIFIISVGKNLSIEGFNSQRLLRSLAYDLNNEAPNIYEWFLPPDNNTELIEWEADMDKWAINGYERHGKLILNNKGDITHYYSINGTKRIGF